MQWIQDGEVWRAGQYEIALAAPGRWVLTIPDEGQGEREPQVFAEMSDEDHVKEIESHSLRALKSITETLEADRIRRQLRSRYMAAFLVSSVAIVVSLTVDFPGFALVLFLSAFVAGWALRRLVDTGFPRFWESVPDVYQ